MTHRVPRRQSGQVIGLAVGVMVAMLAAVALVVDAGFFLVARRELSNTADAAALAAVHVLRPSNPMNLDAGIDPASLVAADAAANAIVVANATGPDTGAGRLCNAEPALTRQEGVKPMNGGGVIYTYAVTLDCEVGFTAGRVLGLLTMSIGASATAALGSAVKVVCPLPVAIVDLNGDISDGFPSPLPLPLLWQFATPSGWQLVDYGASASSSLEEQFDSSCPDPVSVGDLISKDSAVSISSSLKQALRARGYLETGTISSPTLTCPQSFVEVYDSATRALRNPASRCLGIVLVMRSSPSPVTDLLGFTVVFMEKYTSSPNQLTGYYIRAPVQAELGAYNSAGTIVHRLIR